MPPRSSIDTLASAVQKPKCAAPRKRPSGFKGEITREIIPFDAPSLDLTCGTCTEDHRTSVGSGSSLHSSSFHFLSTTQSSSLLESPSGEEQRDAALGAQQSQSRVSRWFSRNADTMLAHFFHFSHVFINVSCSALLLGLLHPESMFNLVPLECRAKKEFKKS
jgi:hypothetical protein